jgi:SAM-dependent methyltransferase
VSAIYDEGYARKYRAHDDEFESSAPSQQLAMWVRGVTERFDGTIDVLDLGCGTGRYFWALTQVNALTGLDASEAMIAEAMHPYRAHEITAQRITLLRGDLLAQTFPPRSFDLVYSIGVLAEHAPLTRGVMLNVHSWLRDDGRFAFTTVHPESPSVPRTTRRRLAKAAGPLLPAVAARAVHQRLLSGGMYADEAAVRELASELFVIESMDRFTSEAHLHVRAVLRKEAA